MVEKEVLDTECYHACLESCEPLACDEETGECYEVDCERVCEEECTHIIDVV